MPYKRSLIDRKVESKSKKKRSIEYEIQQACLNGNPEKAIDCINDAEELNTDKLDEFGVLLHAVELENDTLVEELLKQGCNVNVKNEMNQTPLHLASENGDFQIVQLLVDYDAKILIKDSFQQTALHKAMMNGHVYVAELLFAKTGKRIASLIHKACLKGNRRKIVQLINRDIAINVDEINQKKTIFEAIYMKKF